MPPGIVLRVREQPTVGEPDSEADMAGAEGDAGPSEEDPAANGRPAAIDEALWPTAASRAATVMPSIAEASPWPGHSEWPAAVKPSVADDSWPDLESAPETVRPREQNEWATSDVWPGTVVPPTMIDGAAGSNASRQSEPPPDLKLWPGLPEPKEVAESPRLAADTRTTIGATIRTSPFDDVPITPAQEGLTSWPPPEGGDVAGLYHERLPPTIGLHADETLWTQSVPIRGAVLGRADAGDGGAQPSELHGKADASEA
jgi:hypothetical protein